VIGGLTAIIVALGIVAFRSKPQGNTTETHVIASNPAAPPTATPAMVLPDKPKGSVSPVHAAISTAPSSTAAPVPPPAAPHAVNSRREVALHFTPESTVKLEQLIGDQDKERRKPTLTQTFTRFGIEGTELGASFEHQGRVYFLFGPTVGRLPREPDTIASSDTVDPQGGVHLDFLTNAGNYIAVQPTEITMALLDVPVAGVSLDGQMYVAVSTNFSKGRATDRSILTKFVPPATFQTMRTISQLPEGRFIRMSMHSQPGPIAGLPAGGPFIFTWGTGKYRDSDAYLSIVPAGQFETGKGTRYFAGLDPANAPTWSDNESDATPIVKDGTLGDISVTWSKDLGLWLMIYDRRTQLNGVAFSYSRAPWGPWSEPQILFNAMREGAIGKFIHNPRRKVDDGLAGPVMGPKNRANADEIHGGAYAPFVVERWTKVQGSTLHLYYVLSTGNPYVVLLMESRLQIQ
jgi:hypothetical protein